MDHIENTIKELRQFYRSAYRTSENEINKKINELKSLYPNLYEKDGTTKLAPFKESLSISSIVKKIISQKEKNEDIEYLITAKEYYDKFSKYEHFGVLTLDITHRQFKDERIAEVFQDIFWTNKVILLYLNNLISVWLKQEDKEYQIFNNLRQKIIDLHWIKN